MGKKNITLNNTISLLSIFSRQTPEEQKLNEIIYGWRFDNIDDFILSFEKLNQVENVKQSKKYGNIAKKLTNEILEEDIGYWNAEKNYYYADDELLNIIKNKKNLFQKFNFLYEEIIKRNQWKLEMPIFGIKYDLPLDRYKNDFKRFQIIFNFFKKNKPMCVRDVDSGKKIKIFFSQLNKHEQNEIEKVFYKLLNKIRRKTNGHKFLKKLENS